MSSLTPAQHKEEEDVKNMINMLLFALFKNDTDMLRKYLKNKETILSYLKKNDHRAWTLLYMINDVESLIKMLRNYKDENIKAECIEFSDDLEKLHKGYVAKRVIRQTVTTHHKGLFVNNSNTRNIIYPTTMHPPHPNNWWPLSSIHRTHHMPIAHATAVHVHPTATSAKHPAAPAQQNTAAAEALLKHQLDEKKKRDDHNAAAKLDRERAIRRNQDAELKRKQDAELKRAHGEARDKMLKDQHVDPFFHQNGQGLSMIKESIAKPHNHLPQSHEQSKLILADHPKG